MNPPHADGKHAAPAAHAHAHALPRVACIAVPALPLQLALRAHPEWRADPVTVVDDDRPQARILFANRRARELRIHPGQRFQDAQAFAHRLHAAVVSRQQVELADTELLRTLLTFSPTVEPSKSEPGTFAVDVGGLNPLFTSLDAWAHDLHATLRRQGYVASIVVGFTRFHVFAIARTRAGRWLVLPDAATERRLADAVPFAVVAASDKLRARMDALGIRTLGDFLRLPAGDLRRGFGREAAELHARATGAVEPIHATIPREPIRFAHEFEFADADVERFAAVLAQRLDETLPALRERREAITALRLRLCLDRAPERRERLATATPTLDTAQLLELVRLRLQSTRLPGPIVRFEGELESAVIPHHQLALSAPIHRRDLAAAARAMARVEATFGTGSVTHARLVAEHLPERSFRFERAAAPTPPTPPTLPRTDHPPLSTLPLVRTLHHEPIPVDAIRSDTTGTPIRGHGRVQRMHGPFRTDVHWWRERVERDDYFVETDDGAILWVFEDRRTRRWYVHGRID